MSVAGRKVRTRAKSGGNSSVIRIRVGRIVENGKYDSVENYPSETVHEIYLVSLDGEFATLIETAKLFEFLGQ